VKVSLTSNVVPSGERETVPAAENVPPYGPEADPPAVNVSDPDPRNVPPWGFVSELVQLAEPAPVAPSPLRVSPAKLGGAVAATAGAALTPATINTSGTSPASMRRRITILLLKAPTRTLSRPGHTYRFGELLSAPHRGVPNGDDLLGRPIWPGPATL
jgi:hypothetical protein